MRRGLTEHDLLAVGYKSIPFKGLESQTFLKRLVELFNESVLPRCPGFVDKNGRTSFWTAHGSRGGYVVPYRDENGRITGLQMKLLGGRYLMARNSRAADIYHMAGRLQDGEDLYLIEGGTKAQVAYSFGGLKFMGVPGQSLAGEHIKVITRLRPGRVIVALDEEANVNTARARERWLRALSDTGLPTYRAVWEGSDVGGPKGIDDLVVTGRRPRIRAVTFVPAALGERRHVRATIAPGPVAAGISLTEARLMTSEAIGGFVESTGRSR